MVDKYFISADQLRLDSFRLANQVLDSGFRPDFLVAFWRGGTPVGITMHEYFKYHDLKTDHIPIRTSKYDGVDKQKKNLEIYGLGYLIERVNADDSVLFVDDVWDTGSTMQGTLQELRNRARLNTPRNIKVATPYFKPLRNETSLEPDFYLHTINKWIYFPHELEDLTVEEITAEMGPEIGKLFKK